MSALPALRNRLLDKSPRYYWQWLRAGRHTDDLMASVDMGGFQSLKQFKGQTGHPHYKKYFNMNYWLRRNMQRVLFLGLHRSPPLSILDIGAGFGYFPWAASFFGHKVIGLDLPGDVLFAKSCEFLEVDCRHHTIEKKKPLPDFQTKFDLVTAFQVCFNDHYQSQPWNAESWDFFLSDLFKNQINAGGQVYLELNYSPHIRAWLPACAERLFKEKYQARFNGPSRVFLKRQG